MTAETLGGFVFIYLPTQRSVQRSGNLLGVIRCDVETDAPEKADVIIEITAPEESSGVSVSSSTKPSAQTGRMEQSSSSSKLIGCGAMRVEWRRCTPQ